MRPIRVLGALVVTLAAAMGTSIFFEYRHDLSAARARISAGSAIASTRCGPIEYASAGNGPAVLMVHGAGGGFDQGMLFAEALVARGYRVVAPSRFGYLRTPMPADASPAAQADAHACLLDALGIARVAVLGVSAGAPSSMQFAIRHPQRTRGLFLLVPLAYRPGPVAPPPRIAVFVYERVLRSDFGFWLLVNAWPDLMVKTILATPPEILRRADENERRRADVLMDSILPVSARAAGLLNDGSIGTTITRYELERISAPTLLASLPDDGYGTYESAKYTASQIRGARFVEYPSGGHIWVGHHREVLDLMGRFFEGLERNGGA